MVVSGDSSIRMKQEVLLCGSVVHTAWLVKVLPRKVWLLEVRLCQRCCWQRLWRRLLLQMVVLWWAKGWWKCCVDR